MENNKLGKKQKVAICAIIKDELPYLLEWIAYHRVIGVDRFFIYDNESTDGSTKLLDKLEKANIITHIKFPDSDNIATQHAAYNDCLQRAMGMTEWIAFIDADEFILPHQHQNLKALLEDYSDVDAIAINWKIFGSSGNRYKEDALLMERFTKCSTTNFNSNGNIKTVAKINDIDHVGTHTCVFKSHHSKKYIYPDREPIPKVKFIGFGKHINHDIVQINHYFTKSLEEWHFKRARGRADMRRDNPNKIRGMSAFQGMDRNVEEDLKILKFLQRTKNEIKLLKSLAQLSQIEDELDKSRKVYEQKLIDNRQDLFLFPASQEFENGDRLMGLGKVDEAIAAYKFAIKFNPTCAWYHYQLGKILLQRGENNAAFDYFEKATQNYKNNLKLFKSKITNLEGINDSKTLKLSSSKKLVHCVLLTFYFNEVLERCLDGLLAEKGRIDVTVIENSSVNSDAIRKVVDLYRDKGLVKNHFIFEENIGTNAFEVAVDSNLLDLDYQFITVTDGDLIPDKGWLDEQIKILKQYAEVFSVSSDLYYHNAPPPVRQMLTKIPIESENEIYKERLAGWWLKTFRGKDWQDFMTFRKANNIYFHDKSAYDYGKLKRNMKSVLAKSFKSYHLTWDYVNEDYRKMKEGLRGKTSDPWYHDRYSSFKLITVNDRELSVPAPVEVPHQRIS